MDHDAQLIEAVGVRRHRLLTAFTHGTNPTEQRWRSRGRLYAAGAVLAAVICALCVLVSLVILILTTWLESRAEVEQPREQPRLERQQPREEGRPTPPQLDEEAQVSL